MDEKQPILVVNSGSSSLKLCLFTKDQRVSIQQDAPIDFAAAFDPFFSEQMIAIGHRVVHGGSKYVSSVWVNDQVLEDLEELCALAPLHNKPTISAIRYCEEKFPKIPQYLVFDTAFHRTMPLYARTYAIPSALATKYHIERYGFHGIAHASSYNIFEKKYSPAKVISCHLGSGCSLTAIDRGLSRDTSMGFTPNEGVVMSTRSGDIDPGLFEFLSRKEGYSIERIEELLNFESGLLGVSETSSSMQELIQSANPKAVLAVELFCYRVLKTIGAYFAVLQGCEALLFSGGIGENSPLVRQKILDPLSWIGIKLDDAKNKAAIGLRSSEIFEISSFDSKVKVCVIGNDENSFIRDQYPLLKKG